MLSVSSTNVTHRSTTISSSVNPGAISAIVHNNPPVASLRSAAEIFAPMAWIVKRLREGETKVEQSVKVLLISTVHFKLSRFGSSADERYLDGRWTSKAIMADGKTSLPSLNVR